MYHSQTILPTYNDQQHLSGTFLILMERLLCRLWRPLSVVLLASYIECNCKFLQDRTAGSGDCLELSLNYVHFLCLSGDSRYPSRDKFC